MLLLAPLYLLVLVVAFVAMRKAAKSSDSAAGTASTAAVIAGVLGCAIPIVLFWGSMAAHGGFSGAYQNLWLFMSPVLCIASFVLSMIAFGRIERADAKRPRGMSDAKPHEVAGLDGTCPNCSAGLPLQALECSVCKARFGPGAAWSVRPRSKRPGSR